MKLFGLDINLKGRKKAPLCQGDSEISREDTSLEEPLEVHDEGDTTSKARGKGKEGDLKSSHPAWKKRRLIPLLSLLLILIGIVARGPVTSLFRDRVTPSPTVDAKPITPPIKPEDIMKVVYENGEATLLWNLSPALTGPGFTDYLKSESLNLWVEFNERGTLLYHELLESQMTPEEEGKLMKFLPKLKAVYRMGEVPHETMFLARLSLDQDTGSIIPDLEFLQSKSQAVNYLMGRPLDYVEIDSRVLQANTLPIISGRVTGIMVGATSSVLLENGKNVKVGDRVRDGIVDRIAPRYILVKTGDTYTKIYVGQQL